jgi:hypothetical protein
VGVGTLEGWRLSPPAGLCHVQWMRTENKEADFSTLLLWYLVFIVCSTNLSLSFSPLASLFFIFLSQQIHLNAILFLKHPFMHV